MYKFQDYYGDYYGEEAPCDPYYEDCTVEEEPMEEDDMMMEEESAATPMLVMAFGIVPVLDLSAGLWNNSELDGAEIDEWDTMIMYELGIGAVSLLAWGSAAFMANTAVLPMWSKVNILLEAVAIYLVYNANDTSEGDSSISFAYAAHAIGLGYSAFAMTEIDAWASGDVEEEEWYGDEYYGAEEEYAAEDDYYGGDYYNDGYY